MAQVLVLLVLGLFGSTTTTTMNGASDTSFVKRYDNSKDQGARIYGPLYNIGLGWASSQYGHHKIRNNDQSQGYYEILVPSGTNQKVSYTVSKASGAAAAPTFAHKYVNKDDIHIPTAPKKKEKTNKHSKILKKRLVTSKNKNEQINIYQATRPTRATTSFFNFGSNGDQANNILGKSVSTSTSSVSSRVSVGTEVSQSRSSPAQISSFNQHSGIQPNHGSTRTLTNRQQILQTIGRDVTTRSQPHIVQVNNKPALLVPSRPLPKNIKSLGSVHSFLRSQSAVNSQPPVSSQPPVNSQSSSQPVFINTHQRNIPTQVTVPSQRMILPSQTNSPVTIMRGNPSFIGSSTHINNKSHIVNPILSHINEQLALNVRSRPIITSPQQVSRFNQNTSPNHLATNSQHINSLTTTSDGRLSLLVPSRPITSSQQSSKSDSRPLSIQKATPITFSIPSSTGSTNIRTMDDIRDRLNQVLLELFTKRSRHQKPKNNIHSQTVNPPIESNQVEPGVSLFFKKSNFVKPIGSNMLTYQRPNQNKDFSKSEFHVKHTKSFFPQNSKNNKKQDTTITSSPIVRSYTIQGDLNDQEKMERSGRNFGSPEILERLGLFGLSRLAKMGRVTPTKAVPFATFRL